MYCFLLRLDRKNDKDEHPIFLRLSRNGVRKRINIGVAASLDDWDDQQERLVIRKGLKSPKEKELNEERKNKNEFIERLSHRAKSIIDQFEEDRVDWTANQFIESFNGKLKQSKFYDYLTNHIQVLDETGRIGNANAYKQAENMLLKFDKRLKERMFSEIDLKYINKFDAFLMKRGCSGNTRKYYHKSIRAIYNKAIQEKEAREANYPYGKGGFKIASLEEETLKRYLTNDDLDKIKKADVDSNAQSFARNLFLFSYYCHGMAFVDMAHLKTKNLIKHNDGWFIVYKRQKTKTTRLAKLMQIKLTPEIENIINALKVYQKPIGDYLLPIVTIDHEGVRLYDHIKQRNKRFNINLKNLAKVLEIDFNLTSYVARHTMAMKLQSSSVSRETISQALGHSDMQTTNIYLDSLDSSVIDKAMENL